MNWVVISRALSALILLIYPRKVFSYVICPYCDPNHMAFPNLEEAMRGYDVPMGNPNPGRGNSDPGIRNQIFVPMFRNQDGHYRLNIGFITANTQIKCDATWSTDVFDTFSEYINGKMFSSTTGHGIEINPKAQAEIDGIALTGRGSKSRGPTQQQPNSNTPDGGGDSGPSGRLDFNFPTLFSRSWSKNQDIDKVINFFVQEKGSIALSEAVCLTHKIDIADRSQKYFVEPFIDSVKALALANTTSERLSEFRRFVNEFGTHYASTSEMGTKLSVERRYSSKERNSAGVDELKRCNTASGAKVLGFQVELNRLNCSQQDLQKNELDSVNVERMIISTYGSFIADSLSEWSKQVIDLVQENAFSPRPIKRELVSILHLFNEKNFQDVKLENGNSMNFTSIKEWMVPLMANYCSVFELDCQRSGCGIDESCPGEDQVCQPAVIAERNESNLESLSRFVCMPMNSTNNQNISSQVQIGKKLYSDGNLEYVGQLKDGERNGRGQSFYRNGRLAHNGTYKDDRMDGQGEMFYEESGHLLYLGTFRKGLYEDGVMFKNNEEGGILAVFRNGQILDQKYAKEYRFFGSKGSSSEGDIPPHTFIKPHKPKV